MPEFNAVLSAVAKFNEKPQYAGNVSAGVKPNGLLLAELWGKMHRYWCAANYLCVGQIHLLDNPLFCEPLSIPPSVGALALLEKNNA
jgi:xylulose-5-phosphate/fructose-6-phosphate phosphoketolase